MLARRPKQFSVKLSSFTYSIHNVFLVQMQKEKRKKKKKKEQKEEQKKNED